MTKILKCLMKHRIFFLLFFENSREVALSYPLREDWINIEFFNSKFGDRGNKFSFTGCDGSLPDYPPFHGRIQKLHNIAAPTIHCSNKPALRCGLHASFG